MSVRVRFAPSPTGYLHVGGARTALFNWLYARHHGGTFVLRIEDTDRTRSSEEHTRAILDGLAWLGLDVDEGPLHQADGGTRHRAAAERLLAEGAAYRCFCTPEELAARREAAQRTGEGFGYDERCRAVPEAESALRAERGEPFAVRFAVPEGETGWEDLVHGPLAFANESLDDFVILRSDRTPVYNLAVVSDDRDAAITQVIRGDDHISNTPKQILLYGALGAEPPAFAHVPLILGPDGKRLSKRHGAMSVLAYRERGFLAEAMVNFLALLGWSPGDDREVMTMPQLVEAFSLDRVQKKSAVFDLEKLEWLNGRHIARTPARALEGRVLAALRSEAAERSEVESGELERAFPGIETRPERLRRVIDLVKERPRTLPALAGQVAPFFAREVDYEPEAVQRFWKRPAEAAGRLRAFAERASAVEPWEPGPLEEALRGLAEELGIGAGKLIHPLRVALMGQGVSPGIFRVLTEMGRERTLRRIETALGYLDAMAATEAARAETAGPPEGAG